MLRLSPLLRSAARDLGRLPEICEAHRLLASGDASGALRAAQRAAQVVEAVPMAPLLPPGILRIA